MACAVLHCLAACLAHCLLLRDALQVKRCSCMIHRPMLLGKVRETSTIRPKLTILGSSKLFGVGVRSVACSIHKSIALLYSVNFLFFTLPELLGQILTDT